MPLIDPVGPEMVAISPNAIQVRFWRSLTRFFRFVSRPLGVSALGQSYRGMRKARAKGKR